MTLHARRWACALGVAACAVAPARADSLVGIDGVLDADDAPAAVELSHRVEVVLADRTATFQVERELVNPTAHVERLELSITTPTGAVASRLRVLAADRWIDGAVVAAADGEDAWERLTTTGRQVARGPALLSWVAQDALLLRAYPLTPGGHLRVAYTLTAPACYARGRWIVDYPRRAGDELAAPAIHVRGPAGGGRIFTAGALAAELGAPLSEACTGDVVLSDDADHLYLVVDAPPLADGDARFAEARAGATAVMQLALDVPTALAAPPRAARVVFVIDASKTEGADGIAQELAWARGYLAHLPDATFEVVLYRRGPERLLGRFAPARDAARLLAAVDPARLRPGNGSALDRGLALAAELLAPAGGPRRVIAFTDERWRPGWDPATAATDLAALPADAIVHTVTLSPDAADREPSLGRDDTDALAEVAARWGGMAVAVTGGARAPHASFAAAAHELVVPRHLDGVIVHRGPGDDEDLGQLALGVGHYETWHAAPVGRVVVEGKIWGRAWRRELTSTPAAARRWAGLVMGDPLRDQLDPAAQLALATMGAVVSPVTSMLAIDARYGAARLPDGWGENGISGDFCCGTLGSIGTSTTCGIGVAVPPPPPPDPEALARVLAPRAQACAAANGRHRWRLAVDLATTGDEIVDVHVTDADAADAEAATAAGAAAFTACVEDAAWDLDLDDRFVRSTGHYVVAVDGGR